MTLKGFEIIQKIILFWFSYCWWWGDLQITAMSLQKEAFMGEKYPYYS